MFDAFPPLDAARLWCAIGTLDLLRNVGRIEELLSMGWQGHRDLASEPRSRRILGRIRIWVLLPPIILVVVGLAILLWPLVLGYDLRTRHPINWNRKARPEPAFVPRRRELKQRLTVEEAEARERVNDPLGAVPDVPFGFLNGRWQEFLAQQQPGDGLWSFESRRKELGSHVVRQGYAWVRSDTAHATWASIIYQERLS
jgi:hypothetical protein